MGTGAAHILKSPRAIAQGPQWVVKVTEASTYHTGLLGAPHTHSLSPQTSLAYRVLVSSVEREVSGVDRTCPSPQSPESQSLALELCSEPQLIPHPKDGVIQPARPDSHPPPIPQPCASKKLHKLGNKKEKKGVCLCMAGEGFPQEVPPPSAMGALFYGSPAR